MEQCKKRVMEMVTGTEHCFYPQIQTPEGKWSCLPNPKNGQDLVYENLQAANDCLKALPVMSYQIHEYTETPLQQV